MRPEDTLGFKGVIGAKGGEPPTASQGSPEVRIGTLAGPLQEWEASHTSGIYPKRDLIIQRGEGVYLYDMAGNCYLDCVAGHGVAALGHANPALTKTLQRQSRKPVTCPEIF